MESPAGQDAVAVLKEMFSDEVFVYGGNNIAETIKLLMEVNSMARSARMEAAAEGEDPESVMPTRCSRNSTSKLGKGLACPRWFLAFASKTADACPAGTG